MRAVMLNVTDGAIPAVGDELTIAGEKRTVRSIEPHAEAGYLLAKGVLTPARVVVTFERPEDVRQSAPAKPARKPARRKS